MIVDIYHVRRKISCHSRFSLVIKVYVAMKKVPGPERTHEPTKGLEAEMTPIGSVMNPAWCCMRQKYIEIAPPKYTVEDEAGSKPEGP